MSAEVFNIFNINSKFKKKKLPKIPNDLQRLPNISMYTDYQ